MNDNNTSLKKTIQVRLKKLEKHLAFLKKPVAFLKEPLTFRQLWMPVSFFIIIELFLFFSTNDLRWAWGLASVASFCCFIVWCCRKSITRTIHLVVSLVPTLFFLGLLCHHTCNCNVCTIADMTISTISKYFDHKNDWVAIIIATFSLVYAVYTWRSQESTQKNTQRITPEIQKGILLDFIRHSYRNMTILAAMRHKLKSESDGFEKYYPADYHILKMQTDESAIYPEIFLENTELCGRLHEFRLFVRNGNIELKVVNDHLKNPNLNAVIKEHDLDVLGKRIKDIIDRTSLLIKEIYKIEPCEFAVIVSDYLGKRPSQKSEVQYDNHNKEVESAITNEPTVMLHSYTIEQDYSAFIDILFPKEDEKTLEEIEVIREKSEKKMFVFAKDKSDFLDKFNADIYLELPKIDLIPF